jgi:DNA-binding MarR family transcriptional regulator
MTVEQMKPEQKAPEQAVTGPYYSVDSLKPGTSVGYLIKRCGILITQLAERRFQSQPINFTQWMILMWLTERPHGSPTELSVHLGYDMGSLTRVVDELEREGLVQRARCTDDRRAVQIAITAEGRRMAQAEKRFVVEQLNAIISPCSHEEIEVLIPLLHKLIAHMQELVRSPEAAAGAAPAGAGKDRPRARADAPVKKAARRQTRR